MYTEILKSANLIFEYLHFLEGWGGVFLPRFAMLKRKEGNPDFYTKCNVQHHKSTKYFSAIKMVLFVYSISKFCSLRNHNPPKHADEHGHFSKGFIVRVSITASLAVFEVVNFQRVRRMRREV